MDASRLDSPVESLNDYLLLVYTDEEIADNARYHEWWDGGFADVQAVPGLTEGTRLLVDPDQRVGQIPTWKYLVVHGFSGDAEQLKERVSARPAGDGLWLLEAIGDFSPTPACAAGAQKGESPDGPEHIFMALTNAVAGREDEFHEWYDEHHVPDVLAVDCYQTGRRFRIAATDDAGAPWEYIAFYRFVGPVPEMHATLLKEMEKGETVMTDALADDHGAWIYTPVE